MGRVNGRDLIANTPFAACVARDPKGHYARALAGEIAQFTGVDDPYEKPFSPDVRIRTERIDVATCVDHIIRFLRERRLLILADRNTTP